MSLKIDEIKAMGSEEEFENYIKENFKIKHTQEWIIGSGRGEKIFQLMDKFNSEFKKSLILDLGCGYGGISLFLAKKAESVIGVDINRESINVAHLRTKISRGASFSTILSSATNVPLKEASVDFVLINGVLEWIPCSKPYQDPMSTQLEALGEVKRVLKRRGRMLLAIENRYYLRYWLGSKDTHSGLRFVPILPRKVADMVSIVIKGKRYLNRTYSYFELKNILKKLGLTTVKVYMGIPDYVFPEEIVGIDDKEEMRKKISSVRQRGSRRVVWGMLTKMGLMKLFGSNFIVLCQK